MAFEIENEKGIVKGSTLIEIGDESHKDFTSLQMVLVTSSMNHEYTRKAYEKSRSFARRQELLARMADLKNLYFSARKKLAVLNPDRLSIIEREIHLQKETVLSENGLH